MSNVPHRRFPGIVPILTAVLGATIVALIGYMREEATRPVWDGQGDRVVEERPAPQPRTLDSTRESGDRPALSSSSGEPASGGKSFTRHRPIPARTTIVRSEPPAAPRLAPRDRLPLSSRDNFDDQSAAGPSPGGSTDTPSPGIGNAVTPPAFAQATEIVVPVETTAPGHQLVAHGQRVTVNAVVTDTDGRMQDLEVTVTAAEESAKPLASIPHAPGRKQTPKGLLGGFSYEEELFRTKWGWAAFDLARKAAQEASDVGK